MPTPNCLRSFSPSVPGRPAPICRDGPSCNRRRSCEALLERDPDALQAARRSSPCGHALSPLAGVRCSARWRPGTSHADQATACFEHVWLSSILQTVSIADPWIGSFDGQAHSRIVAEYRAADRQHVETAATRVRRAVAEHATRVRDEYPQESDVIEHQARLKRRHLPVRQLFQAAPNVLSSLKPCWAMSPLVVSQLLPAQKLFDVVIFDEASQVTPADAVGALLRAERAVVAGDPKQLPPTNFFAASSGGGEDDEDFEDEVVSLHWYYEHGVDPRCHGCPAAATEGEQDSGLALPVARRTTHCLLQRPAQSL